MNVYYHGFQVNFNSWQIMVPMALAIAATIGWNQWWLTPKLRLRRMYSDGVIKLMTAFAGGLFAILLAGESWRGILQMLDNVFGTDEGLWALMSLVLTPVVIGGASGLFTVVVYYTAKLMAWCHKGSLEEKRDRRLRRMERVRRQLELKAEQHQEMLEVEYYYQEQAKTQVAEAATAEARGLLSLPTLPVIPFRLRTQEKKEKAI